MTLVVCPFNLRIRISNLAYRNSLHFGQTFFFVGIIMAGIFPTFCPPIYIYMEFGKKNPYFEKNPKKLTSHLVMVISPYSTSSFLIHMNEQTKARETGMYSGIYRFLPFAFFWHLHWFRVVFLHLM